MFGLRSGLVTLYLARILGGVFSAAILPTANVYVIEASTDLDRGKSISRLNASIALGILAGPALGAWLSSRNWHAYFRIGHVGVDTFSTPFLVAALLGFLALVASVFMLPEPLRTKHIENIGSGRKSCKRCKPDNRLFIAIGIYILAGHFIVFDYYIVNVLLAMVITTAIVEIGIFGAL